MKKILQISIIAAGIFSGTVFSAGGDQEFDDLHKLTTAKSAVDDVPSEKLSDRAFEALMEEMYPTTPEQLKKIQEKEKEFKNILYDNKSPKALTEIIQVSTKPGSKPVAILVAPFHTSTLNIIDSTGQPWPISAVMYGNDVDYKVTKVDGHAYANIIRIDPKREVGTTNINLSLANLPTTITVTMKNNTDQYHPSPVLQIDKEGPQAKPLPVFSVDNVNSDNVLKNIVLGIAPDNFELLVTSDSNVEAWRNDASLYVRTTYQPSSPLPRGIHHGPAGYAAYRMNDMPVLVMTTDEGYEKKITIKGSDK
jgi:intracellular multiplication protein IcmK